MFLYVLVSGNLKPWNVKSAKNANLHDRCLTCLKNLLYLSPFASLKDANNKTPTQLAFSCGQQEAERRMVLYERARSHQTRRLSKHDDWLQTLPTNKGSPSSTTTSSSSSWSRSPRFPVSRLARSVTPTLALQELSLSPAPGRSTCRNKSWVFLSQEIFLVALKL